MVIIGLVMVAIGGLAIIAIGLRFWFQPEAAGIAYGVKIRLTGDARAYYQIKGIRDIVSGIFVLIPIALGAPRMVAALSLAAALIPMADCVIVLRNGGSKSAAFGIHATTAAYLAIAAMLIFAAAGPVA